MLNNLLKVGLGLCVGIMATITLPGFFVNSNYTNDYQGVFLTNGQVYFGKIASNNNNTLVINEVYYLKLNSSATSANLENLNASQFDVVKLGNEIHGPTGTMWVNQDQVLFTVDLKPESAVVTKIKAI